MIIDFHTHCYNETLAKKAMERMPKNAGLGPYFDCTLKGLKEKMQQSGIDVSVVLSIANRPETTVHVNDFAISIAETPGIVSFGSVHPAFSGFKDEIIRLKDHGIKGLKLHPYYQHYNADEKDAYKVYDYALSKDMVVLLHCGRDALVEGAYNTAVVFGNLARDFSGSKLVGAHLGGWDTWEECEKYVLGKDIYIDTSIGMRLIGEDKRKILFEKHNIDKILFGTDSPWFDSEMELELMHSFLGSGEAFNKVTCKNAEKLLKL